MDKPLETELAVSYRSVSKTAALSIFFLVLALSVLIAKVLVVVPLIGMIIAFVAVLQIRRHPEELIGRPIALVGLIGCGLLFFGGAGFHIYDYATEVLPGYERISWRDLKDNKKTALPFSEVAENLDGKKVFLRGYVRPGTRRKNLKEFILVGDFGTCCFGGSPEITDVVAVSLKGDDRVNYGLRIRKIHGVFRLNPNATLTAEKDIPRVFYEIEADLVQ